MPPHTHSVVCASERLFFFDADRCLRSDVGPDPPPQAYCSAQGLMGKTAPTRASKGRISVNRQHEVDPLLRPNKDLPTVVSRGGGGGDKTSKLILGISMVWQLRHHFGPFLMRLSALCRPARAVWCALLSARAPAADWCLRSDVMPDSRGSLMGGCDGWLL